MKPPKSFIAVAAVIVMAVAPGWVSAQESDGGGDAAAEMAKKLQDPLANIKALMTDNDINFNTGIDETSYGFQLQPVYAMSFDKAGFNLVNRAVIPILGLAPQSTRPPGIPEPLPPGDSLEWGLSDSALQFFFSPKSDSAWKWGVGPMVTLKTRTNDDFAGAGWGGGPIGVLVGGFGNLSTSFIGGHTWGEDGFSVSILQPMLFYNLPNAWNIHYNNIISYNWNAESGDEWTVPLGVGVGKMLEVGGGHGIEPTLGVYYNVARPEGSADWAIKWAVSWLLP